MRPKQNLRLAMFATCWMLLGAANVVADETVTWEHRKAHFTYVGITTLYVCDALESQVRRILVYLGARNDAKVTASCAQPDVPTRQALVNMDFDVAVPAAGNDASNVLQAHWTSVLIQANRPNFIGRGDCELIDGLKDSVLRNFSLRNIRYESSCFPNQLSEGDFAVQGEALKISATR